MRPLYRLTNEFERTWPIEVAYSDLPTLLSPPMYNAATLMSTLAFSALTLLTGLVGRSFISLCYIPSHSMYPSIEVSSSSRASQTGRADASGWLCGCDR